MTDSARHTHRPRSQAPCRRDAGRHASPDAAPWPELLALAPMAGFDAATWLDTLLDRIEARR